MSEVMALRMARAIHEAANAAACDCPHGCSTEMAVAAALAALRTLWEPTEAMMAECISARTGKRRLAGRKVWRAMIEAALEDDLESSQPMRIAIELLKDADDAVPPPE